MAIREIHLYNTLTKKKELFTPLKPNLVTMYHCGPTVYNYAHIGNLRSYVFADILRRTMEYNNYTVKQVINITDIGHLVSDSDDGEDKVAAAAKREGKSGRDISNFYTEAFMFDLAHLNINTHGTDFPRASWYVNYQIDLIRQLNEKGFIYTTSDGLYFDTSKFPEYGKLGNINLEGLEEGKRVAINPEKKNPTDFAVWKFAKQTTEGKREQIWEAPWGEGFPGWHIECSAMAMQLLHYTLDIHTGGVDHIPVHHNNEIAQSEAATGVEFARFWMHNAFLNIDGQKVAKSLGNSILIKDIIEKGYDSMDYRYLLLTASYRTQINFTWEALTTARNGRKSLLDAFHFLKVNESERGMVNTDYQNQFMDAINDDLNTPKALAVVFSLLKDTTISDADKKASILEFDTVLGLRIIDKIGDIPVTIQTLVSKREKARAEKDWKKADEIRDEIKKLGYEIQDNTQGVTLKKI